MVSAESVIVGASFGAFSCVMVVFQLIGFINFPVKLHQTTGLTIGHHRWSTSIWWIIQLALTVICGIMAKRNYDNLFSGLLLTDAMNNYFKFGFGLLTVYVTLADSWFGIERHRSIWIRYRDLATRNGTFFGLIGRAQLVRVLVRFFIVVLVLIVVCAIVERQFYYDIAHGSQWHYFWTYNLYPHTISHLRHVYHLLHISLMTANVRQLQNRLSRLQQLGVAQQLEACRVIYGQLWQINEAINELFGFSQALNIACSFAQIAFDFYWIYTMWMSQDTGLRLQFFCLFPTPVILGFLMNTAKSHQRAMDALETTLLDMDCSADSSLIPLRYFFLTQLLRTRLRLTAKDIFDFDYTLIRKLVIAILTYVILFVDISY